MKKSKLIAVFAIMVIISLVFIGCGSRNPLNGIWVNDEEDIFIAFIDNLFFVGEVYRGDFVPEASGVYTFENNKGTLSVFGEIIDFSLKGNVLTGNVDGDDLDFIKESGKAAPGSLAGVWKGPGRWVFAFVNDMIFVIDRDGDPDYAMEYDFKNNSGSFRTDRYDWEVEFDVKGNTLNVTSSGSPEGEYTRDR